MKKNILITLLAALLLSSCGEYNRFFDLVRLGLLDSVNYLQEPHPNLAKYWDKNYVLKPIPQGYIDLMKNGQDFVNPGY